MTVVTRTSNSMLTKSGESGHSFVIYDLKEKAFGFSLLSVMLAVVLSHVAVITLRCALPVPTLRSVCIINGCWILSNAFSASIDMIM